MPTSLIQPATVTGHVMTHELLIDSCISHLNYLKLPIGWLSLLEPIQCPVLIR